MAEVSPPSSVRKVALLTLGCKLNQADSESMARQLMAAGCRVVDRPVPADAFVVNTCCVTHVADRKSRHLVRLARRLAPHAPVILTGCYVDAVGPRSARAVGADVALGNRDKDAVVRTLLGNDYRRSGTPCQGRDVLRSAGALRTRAFVKVQEGCNDVCAFCIVPRTRGRERSEPIERVVAEVQQRETEGAQEVVLTGTQLGAYGRDLNGSIGLADLMRALLEETAVPRLRPSSLQPQDISAELLALWGDRRLCRHFHLALQSGSDAVLRRMRRRYTAHEYGRAAALVRGAVEGVTITTDVMVGFPGETEVEFEESYAFCRAMGFAAMHVFPFSRRLGTAAAHMPEQVPEPVRRQRAERMLALASELRRAHLSRFVGRVVPVLWERSRENGDSDVPVWEGLTDNYVRVRARCGGDLTNRLLPARLTRLCEGGFLEGMLLV